MQPVFAHEPDQKLEMAEGTDGVSRSPTAADVDDHAAARLEHTPEFASEPEERIYILVLVNVAVGFLEMERVGRRRENEIHRFIGHTRQKLFRLATIRRAQSSSEVG